MIAHHDALVRISSQFACRLCLAVPSVICKPVKQAQQLKTRLRHCSKVFETTMEQNSFCTALVSPHSAARYLIYNTAVGLPTLAFVVFLVRPALLRSQTPFWHIALLSASLGASTTTESLNFYARFMMHIDAPVICESICTRHGTRGRRWRSCGSRTLR